MRMLVVLLSLVSASMAYAQPPNDGAPIDDLIKVTQAAIADVRSRVRPTLKEEEQKILDQIQDNVEPAATFNAQAWRRDQGERIITVSAGVALLMNVLGQSEAVGKRGNVDCMDTHMFRSIKDALEGTASDPPGPPRRVWSLAEFAQIEPKCKDADKLIAGDAEMAHEIELMTKLGLALVILHETAHHMLGHARELGYRPSTQKELDKSRDNEDAADEWAIRKAIEIGEPFALVTPYLLIMAATTPDGVTLERERTSTDPLGVRRTLSVLDNLKDDPAMTPEMLNSAKDARRAFELLLQGAR
jgi:hypothetical protein